VSLGRNLASSAVDDGTLDACATNINS